MRTFSQIGCFKAVVVVLLLLLGHIEPANACMHYKATIPFNPTLPYEASISDNGVTTCWISTSYEEHKALEIAVKQEKSGELKSKGKDKRKEEGKGKGKEKRSNGVHMRLTERKGLGFGKDGKGSDTKVCYVLTLILTFSLGICLYSCAWVFGVELVRQEGRIGVYKG